LLVPVQALTPWVVVLTALLAADELTVPVDLEVELLSKVLRYDRNLTSRATDGISVLVMHVEGTGSKSVGRQVLDALSARKKLAAQEHTERLAPFTNPAELAALVKRDHIDVVVLAPGLAPQAAAIATALDGLDVLTVGTTAEGVREGTVLGFDLVAGRPHMFFNLTQARRQHADFKAEVLQLMTVYP
jgi:YfiR/HmsC-like